MVLNTDTMHEIPQYHFISDKGFNTVIPGNLRNTKSAINKDFVTLFQYDLCKFSYGYDSFEHHNFE